MPDLNVFCYLNSKYAKTLKDLMFYFQIIMFSIFYSIDVTKFQLPPLTKPPNSPHYFSGNENFANLAHVKWKFFYDSRCFADDDKEKVEQEKKLFAVLRIEKISLSAREENLLMWSKWAVSSSFLIEKLITQINVFLSRHKAAIFDFSWRSNWAWKIFCTGEFPIEILNELMFGYWYRFMDFMDIDAFQLWPSLPTWSSSSCFSIDDQRFSRGLTSRLC